ERAAEPRLERKLKAPLRRATCRVGNAARGVAPKEGLRHAPMKSPRRRKGRHVFPEVVIEEGRSVLERVGHRREIDLHEEIVGKVALGVPRGHRAGDAVGGGDGGERVWAAALFRRGRDLLPNENRFVGGGKERGEGARGRRGVVPLERRPEAV